MSERITAYAATLNELNRGDWFQSLSAATKPPVLLLLALSLDRHKWVQAIFLWVLLLSTALVIFVTRLEVVIIFALPIAYYHFRVRKLSAAISGMGFAAFLIIMLALNLWRGGGVSAIDKSELTFKNALSSVGTDLNTVRGYMRLWELYDVGQLPYDYGATYPYILLTPIPRALWNEKPLTSFESRWNVKLFGQQLPTVDGMTGVWIFTPWGEGLAQLGVFGVFLNLFLYGLMLSWIRRRIKGQSLFVLVWFYYSVNAATLLRGSFTSLFFLTCSYFASAVLFYMLANRRSPIHRWLVQNWSEMA